jgi:glutamine synthetase
MNKKRKTEIKPDFNLTANQLERYLKKPSDEFTIEDIINYVFEKDIEMINFRYLSGDEKLKTLNFVVTGRTELHNVLKYGERVNGNTVFAYNFDEQADLYVIPQLNTAFRNPFTEIPTLDILCSFYNWEGQALKSSPENILKNSIELFESKTRYQIKMFGELEYYVISNDNQGYETEGKNYQSSEPFTKFENLRVEALQIIARCGGKIRFGHTEHGSFSIGSKFYEQHEIEFLPEDPVKAIQQLTIAKWIIRMLGRKYKVTVSFSPKIAMDRPGNGLHLHFILEKNGINILGDGSEFRKSALQMISGILKHAGALTAFGNSLPVSYLRLNKTQIAPHYICWGPSNRSALIRIPKINMKALNERKRIMNIDSYDPLYVYNQSLEYRGTDSTAYLHFFVAAILIAGLDGLDNEYYLKDNKKYFLTKNLYYPENETYKTNLESLPDSCSAAAENLQKEKKLFTEKFPVFPEKVLNYVIDQLISHHEEWCINPGSDNKAENIEKMIVHFMHYR